MKYGAFISYRRVEPDAQIAIDLQSSLESSRTPASLIRQGARGAIGRVFLDRGENAVGRLQKSLGDALTGSEALIVICSRETPKSPWVNEEVEQFLQTHSREPNVLVVLVEGEPKDVCPPAVLRLLAASADSPPTLIRYKTSSRQRWWVHRTMPEVVEAIVAACLRIERGTLSLALRRRQRRRAWMAAASVLATTLAITSSVVLANSRIVWNRMSEQRLPERALMWDLSSHSAGSVDAIGAPDGGAWSWEPQSNTFRRRSEQVLRPPTGRHLLVYHATGVVVRDALTGGDRTISELSQQAVSYGPKFDAAGERLLVATRDGDRMGVRIVSLETLNDVAVVDLGRLSNQLPPGEPAEDATRLSTAELQDRNASLLWQRVRLMGDTLIAPAGGMPLIPMVRRLQQDTPPVSLVKAGQFFGFLLAIHPGSSRIALLAVTDEKHAEACVWSLSPVPSQSCADLSKDSEADFEGAAFSQSGDTFWLLGYDRLAAFRSTDLRELLYVRPPERFVVAEPVDEDSSVSWAVWTAGGSNWASGIASDFRVEQPGSVDVSLIRQAWVNRQTNRILLRFDRRLDLVEPSTWDTLTSVTIPEGVIDARLTLDGMAWSAQSSQGLLIVGSLQNGREIARVAEVAGKTHRAWLDANCGELNVLSGAGQMLRFHRGRQYFDRWFVPGGSCP